MLKVIKEVVLTILAFAVLILFLWVGGLHDDRTTNAHGCLNPSGAK